MSLPALALGAIGTQVFYGDGASPEAWTLITNASSYTGPTMSGNVVDVTNNNTTNPWRRKVVTLLDPGEIPFDMYFIPSDTGQKAILSLFTTRGLGSAQTPIPFKVTFADVAATTWLFSGFISKFSISAAVDNVVKAAVVITCEGQPTFPA